MTPEVPAAIPKPGWKQKWSRVTRSSPDSILLLVYIRASCHLSRMRFSEPLGNSSFAHQDEYHGYADIHVAAKGR
jgi:hypothetical protein